MTTIARIDAYPIVYPEPHDSGRARSLVLVRVSTADGIDGWGECATQFPEASLAVTALIDSGFAPKLIGHRVDPAAAWETLHEHSFWYAGGLAAMAISGIDIALWDLSGKLADLPVHALLGGSASADLRACASVLFDMDDIAATATQFAAYAEAGYTAVKGGWGKSPDAAFGLDPRLDMRLLRAIRDAVGAEVDLAVDVGTHVRWPASHAIRMCRQFEEVGVLWVEEPLPADDLAGYRRLRSAVAVAIAAGEKESALRGFRDLILSGGVDIVMPDPGKAAGITGTKRVLDLARAHGLRFTLHSWSSAINTAAAAHLALATTNGVVFEVKPHPSPMHDDLIDGAMRPVGGRLDPPFGPGLGIGISEATVDRYLMR